MLQPPRHSDGRPKVLDEPLVRVDRRGQHGHDVRQALEEACQEVPAQIGQGRNVVPLGVGVRGVPGEQVLAVAVDDGDVHVAAVSGEALFRLGHEARRDAVVDAHALDDVLEQAGAVGHVSHLAELEGRFVDARAGLGVPALDVAGEAGTRVVHVVVPVLVVDGAVERVAEHALGQGGQLMRRVLQEEAGRGGRVAVWVAEGVEFVFSFCQGL